MKFFSILLTLFFLFSCVESTTVVEEDTSSPVTPSDPDNNTSKPNPSDGNDSEFMRPIGTYSSLLSGEDNNNPIINHGQANGVLLRATWNKLEPSDGTYDFSSIDEKIAIIKNNTRNEDFFYTLAISAGCGSAADPGYPKWMNNRADISKWTIKFRDNTCSLMPKGWDDNYLNELRELATALAQKYKGDKNLKLVYVPQATGNGIEGHFNGNFSPSDKNDWSPLTSQGLSKETWKYAMKQAGLIFAEAFDDRAVAIEVHHIIDRVDIPMEALNELYEDERTGKRVGLAMWWLFGKDEHMDLVEAMVDFPGDIYGQVGASSIQPTRIGGCNYTSVLDLAIDMGMRYIEPWDREYKEGGNFGIDSNAYAIQKENFRLFNEYAHAKFIEGGNPSRPVFVNPSPTNLDPKHDPNVNGKSCPGIYSF